MRKILLALGIVLLTSSLYASPDNSMNIPNAFSPNTTIQSSKVNDNNNEVSGKYNVHTHTDITQVGSVTSGSWLGTPVSTQYGGTGKDFSASASGALIYFSSTGTTTTLPKAASGAILITDAMTLGPNWLTAGANGTVLKSNGPTSNPSWTDAGKVVQVVSTTTGAYASTAATIPFDDTVPLITEGDEFITLAITPKSATNRLKVDVVFNGSNSGGSDSETIALFNTDYDVGNEAVATAVYYESIANHLTPIGFSYMTATAPIVATTFRVRGGTTGNTLYFNGTNAGREMGGSLASSITITEIQTP